MEDVEDKPPPSKPSSVSAELKPLAETPEENTELINPPNNQSSIEAPINNKMDSGTHLPVADLGVSPKDGSASTPKATIDGTEQSHQEATPADSERGALEEGIFNRQQQDGVSTATASSDVDNSTNLSTSSYETKDLQNGGSTVSAVDNLMDLSTSSSQEKELQNDHKELNIDPSQTKDAVVVIAGDSVDNQINLLDPSSEKIERQNDLKELKIKLPKTKIADVSVEAVDSPAVSDDNETKLLASSSEKIIELQSDPKERRRVPSQTNISDVAAVDSPSFDQQIAEKRGLIDTAAPFESVKQAVSKFGGIVDWKAHRVQTVERRKHVEHELDKAQQEIPVCRKKSQAAVQAKVQVLQELDTTKRLIEELKLNLERAQTEERQVRQDSELAKLRVEEMEQGIADDSSVAAKAQLEVAKARYLSAITELTSVKQELEGLRGEYASLVDEKYEAIKRAEVAVASSKQVEKTVEDLTIELIATKEALESSHAAHMEAEEHRIGTIMARDQDSLNWEKELKQLEDEIQSLNQKILSAKDLKSKLNKASALLLDLKDELNAYLEPVPEEQEKTPNEIQEAVASAKKELEEVNLNIEKATTEVNYLKVAAASLKTELENEKSSFASIRQREGMASVTVASLDAELDNTRSQMALVQMKEKEGREKIAQLPKKLQQAIEEANQANLLAQEVREELRRVKEEAEQEKAGANTMQRKLLAAQKEIEAARASERLAIAATKALQESDSSRCNNEAESSSWVTLSVEEYYNLSKQAYEAEDQAKTRVEAANSDIKIAKESELKTLEKLSDVTSEMATRRESLKIAMEKAEKAREGKLGVEQELRKWRAEHEQQRRRAGGSSQGGVVKQSSKILGVSFERHKEANHVEQTRSASIASPYFNSPKSFAHSNSVPSVDAKKKKKKSFFPWVLMFFGKKKAQSSH